MKKTLITNSLMSESESNMEDQKKAEFLAAIKLVSGEELLAVIEHFLLLYKIHRSYSISTDYMLWCFYHQPL